MKTLPKHLSTEWIEQLTMREAMNYKNKFLGAAAGGGKIILSYFLNPHSSFSRHEAVATREIKKQARGYSSATLTEVDHDNMITTYTYKVA